jgi:hypothetical protein
MPTHVSDSAKDRSKLEGHKSLISIKSTGKITSAIPLSVTGDVHDFADDSPLASYLLGPAANPVSNVEEAQSAQMWEQFLRLAKDENQMAVEKT